MSNINETLKLLRTTKNLTQAETAELLHIPKGTYVTYEYGTREPNIEIINQLANLFCVSTDFLLGRSSNEHSLIDQLAIQYNLSECEKQMLVNYICLPTDHRKIITTFLQNTFRKD